MRVYFTNLTYSHVAQMRELRSIAAIHFPTNAYDLNLQYDARTGDIYVAFVFGAEISENGELTAEPRVVNFPLELDRDYQRTAGVFLGYIDVEKLVNAMRLLL